MKTLLVSILTFISFSALADEPKMTCNFRYTELDLDQAEVKEITRTLRRRDPDKFFKWARITFLTHDSRYKIEAYGYVKEINDYRISMTITDTLTHSSATSYFQNEAADASLRVAGPFGVIKWAVGECDITYRP